MNKVEVKKILELLSGVSEALLDEKVSVEGECTFETIQKATQDLIQKYQAQEAQLRAQAVAQAKAETHAQMESRLHNAMDMITDLAGLNFDRVLEIKGDNGLIDGLCSGLNMLAEELKFSVVSKKSLEEKNALIESIVENIPVALFLKDAKDDFRISLWNKAAEEIFEVPRTAVLGKTTHDLWPKEHADLYQAVDLQVVQNAVNVHIPEEPATTPSRGQVTLNTRKVPLRVGLNDEVSYLLGICEDITDRKRAERVMLNSAKMASLGEMAGGIAHEINNPLAIIQGKAGLLINQLSSGTCASEQAIDHLKKIISNTERITKIINGLKSFSRNSDKDPFASVGLKTLIGEVIGLCSEKYKDLRVKLEVSQLPDLNLDCRASQVEQVILNLLHNALDAVGSLPEKWVKLNLDVRNEKVEISVTDSGRGIPSQVVEKMMQPFFTTKEVGKGTGLGLSISKGIVEDHHGVLRYDSSCTNTRFLIELPLKQKAA